MIPDYPPPLPPPNYPPASIIESGSSRQRSRSKGKAIIEEEVPQLQPSKRKASKSREPEVEVIPVLPQPKPQKRAVSEGATPVIPKRLAIKDRDSQLEEEEVIPQLVHRSRERSRTQESETPQLKSTIARGMQLLMLGAKQRRSTMDSSRYDMGTAMQRARARLQSQEGKAGLKITAGRPANVSDMVEQIERSGMPTDLSPRLKIKRPLSLSLEPFVDRPLVNIRPVGRRTRVR